MDQQNIILNRQLKINSYAKINLFLDIIKKMPEPAGYHEIMTLFSSIELCDTMHFYISTLEHVPDFIAKSLKLNYKKTSSGVINMQCENLKVVLCAEEETEKCYSVPVDDSNTVAIAVKKFFDFVPFKKLDKTLFLYILFDKNIPAGAGLGGGSSDAASTLRALNLLFELNQTDDELTAIAKKVGADVAFMLKGGATLACGIGEKFDKQYDFAPWPLVLIYPNFEVSSRDAYAGVKNFIKYNLSNLSEEDEIKLRNVAQERAGRIADCLAGKNFGEIGKHIFNKLEEPVLSRKHQIRELKETLRQMGYENVLMTGSGSSVYTLLDPSSTQEELNVHFEKIRTEMQRKFSKTYKVILTKTRKASPWEKILS